MPRETLYGIPKIPKTAKSLPTGGPSAIMKAIIATKTRNAMSGRCSNNNTYRTSKRLQCPNKRRQSTTSKSASKTSQSAKIKSQRRTTNNRKKTK